MSEPEWLTVQNNHARQTARLEEQNTALQATNTKLIEESAVLEGLVEEARKHQDRLKERIAELEKQLAREQNYRQYWKNSPDKAWAENAIKQDELVQAEKREAVLREALDWLTHLGHGVGKAGGAPEHGEFEDALNEARAALEVK